MNDSGKETAILDLSGAWSCRLDDEDTGLRDKWFEARIGNGTCSLPGTTSENGLGEKLEADLQMNKESLLSLRQHYRFVGAAWYQREIRIPDQWEGKHVELFLERVMFESRVWVDGVEAGMQDSLSTPHRFSLSGLMRPGRTHTLTIRVDNREFHQIGTYSSAYTDATQTIWNGIVGRIELHAIPLIHLKNVDIYPDVDTGVTRVKVKMANMMEAGAQVRLSISDAPGFIRLSCETRLDGSSEKCCELEYAHEGHPELWDEFNPSMHNMVIGLFAQTESGYVCEDSKCVAYGIRSIQSDGARLEINNRATFLRGTLDCCIYPLTGYPPMQSEAWERVFRIVKDYGLNHVRFHSWCPPEAAFQAADQLGVYLQVEGPVWMDTWNLPVGSQPGHYEYLPAEARRIVEYYGNHPSFCLFANGNELNGDFELLHQIIKDLKSLDNRRLYTLTANWDRPADPEDDLFIAQTVDGIGIRGQYFKEHLGKSTMFDYREAVSLRQVPVLSHEVGQYSVYPNMEEIEKYSGVLRPVNFETIRADLELKGLLEDAPRFVKGSGMLALQLYREEIEAALRTPGMGGFQLLDLHDFPGQSTATVGILDSFWESKGFIEPERFRRFCGPSVVLLRMWQRVYLNDERFTAEIAISHYARHDVEDAVVEWTIGNSSGETLDRGFLEKVNIPAGDLTSIGLIDSDCFQYLSSPSHLCITVSVVDAAITNSWDLWVYPRVVPDEKALLDAGNTMICRLFDEAVERHLDNGGNVLLLPYGIGVRDVYPGKFIPVFWSPVHFVSEDPCGMYIDAAHPIFAEFPTDCYASFQWKELLDRSESIALEDFPAGVHPLAQVIPNFYHNRKMANLWEWKVGNGKMVVCSMDLDKGSDDRRSAKQLRTSILSYMASERFQPENAVTIAEARKRFDVSFEGGQNIRIDGIDLAIGRPTQSDSELAVDYSSAKGNDGIYHTMWMAADDRPGHWWQVDLGELRTIAGTKVEFAEAANFLYVIQVSEDGKLWRTAVNQTGQTETERIRTDLFMENARYVRMVYNGIPQGGRAGHKKFEVYGT